MQDEQNLSLNWGDLCRSLLGEAWLGLLTRQDINVPRRHMNHMRAEQRAMEGAYLASFPAQEAKLVALELIAIYHLATAAERIAVFIGNERREKSEVQAVLGEHFERAQAASKDAGSNELGWLCVQLQTQAHACLRGEKFSATPKLVALLRRWSGNL